MKIIFLYYSKSRRFGLRDGSLDKKPKINNDTKKITVVYTKIFKVNMQFFLGTVFNTIYYTKRFKFKTNRFAFFKKANQFVLNLNLL